MPKKKFSMEQAFSELETIVKELEDDSTELLDSVALYTKGVKLLKECNDNLDKIEKEIIVIGDEDE